MLLLGHLSLVSHSFFLEHGLILFCHLTVHFVKMRLVLLEFLVLGLLFDEYGVSVLVIFLEEAVV